jgi:hypothetical protein
MSVKLPATLTELELIVRKKKRILNKIIHVLKPEKGKVKVNIAKIINYCKALLDNAPIRQLKKRSCNNYAAALLTAASGKKLLDLSCKEIINKIA